MSNKKTYSFLVLLCALFAFGCTNDLAEINTNPNQNQPNNIDPELQFI